VTRWPRRSAGRARRWTKLAAGVLLVLAACAPPPRPDWRAGQGYEALFGEMWGRFGRLGDLVAEVRLTVGGDGARERATAVLQYKAPDRFLIEVRGPLMAHVLTAVVLGDSLYVHGPAAGGSVLGRADEDLVWRLTGVDLGSCNLPHALLGVVEPGQVDAVAALPPTRSGRAVVPLLAPPGQTRRVWVDVGRGLMVREELGRRDGWELVRTMGRYRRVGEALLPQEVELRQGDRWVRLEYVRCWADRGVSEAVFRGAARAAQAAVGSGSGGPPLQRP